jgi:hypothetical protein
MTVRVNFINGDYWENDPVYEIGENFRDKEIYLEYPDKFDHNVLACTSFKKDKIKNIQIDMEKE